MKSKEKIYLVGLPGTGKSYFGKILESETKIPFFDLDKWIEEKEGREITDIFANDGEEAFRKIEADGLRQLSQHDHFIVATGGGTPCFHEGMKYMNERGITVYLTEKKETLVERLSRSSHRPLVQNDVEKRIDELLAAREHVYKQANIEMADRDPKQLIALINDLKFESNSG